jgi:hypothetical protein
MAFPINTYTKSAEAYRRALKVIPSGIYGHQGPAEGCFVPVSAFPFFSERAKGSYFWDLDGNRFIDYMCAYGPNVLGYNDAEVDEAAAQQRAKADCVTSPSSIMVDFAELLVETVAGADWAFFAKNGGDVTTLAVITARAKRKKRIFVLALKNSSAPGASVVERRCFSRIFVSLTKLPVKNFNRVKPLQGMGLTVPSIKPLNFSQFAKDSLISQSAAPSSASHIPSAKRRVIAGPPLTVKPTLKGFPPGRAAFSA